MVTTPSMVEQVLRWTHQAWWKCPLATLQYYCMHADIMLQTSKQTSKQELARVCMQSAEINQSCMTGGSKGVEAGGRLQAVVTVVTTRPSTRPGVRGTVRPSGSTKGFSPMSLMKLLMNTSNPAHFNQSINRSIDQSINRSIDRSIDLCFLSLGLVRKGNRRYMGKRMLSLIEVIHPNSFWATKSPFFVIKVYICSW